jgi:hypothetical protein
MQNAISFYLHPLKHYAASRKVGVRFPMSFDFSIDLILPAVYGLGVDSASNRNEYYESFLGLRAAGSRVRHRHLSADCLENVGASTSHNPVGVYGLLQGQLYLCYLSILNIGDTNKRECNLLSVQKNPVGEMSFKCWSESFFSPFKGHRPSWCFDVAPETMNLRFIALYSLHPLVYHDLWFSGRQHNNENKPVEFFFALILFNNCYMFRSTCNEPASRWSQMWTEKCSSY